MQFGPPVFQKRSISFRYLKLCGVYSGASMCAHHYVTPFLFLWQLLCTAVCAAQWNTPRIPSDSFAVFPHAFTF